jgi:type IV secretory pathway TrbF-like protein
MSTTSYPAPDLNNTRWSRSKAEQVGGLALVNTWLLVVVGLLAATVVLLGCVVWGNTKALASFRPIVVRINELGAAQASYLQNTVYRPQSAEVKHFLSDFVTKYYTHKKERLADYYLSKYYLSRQLGFESWQEDQQTQWVKKVLNGQLEQCEAQVRKVSITNLATSPYEALVEFQRIVYANGTDQEIRREDLTATIRFTFADKVDSRMVQYNPLGLAILDFHSDQAFH